MNRYEDTIEFISFLKNMVTATTNLKIFIGLCLFLLVFASIKAVIWFIIIAIASLVFIVALYFVLGGRDI